MQENCRGSIGYAPRFEFLYFYEKSKRFKNIRKIAFLAVFEALGNSRNKGMLSAHIVNRINGLVLI